MDSGPTTTRLIAVWVIAMVLTFAWGTSLMTLADAWPNGIPRALVWDGGFVSAILIGPLIIHHLHGRKRGAVTPLYIASVLFYILAAFALLTWVAFHLAWRRGNVEL